eukprot:351965-Chlamydomonas_euryale.AAC.23
MHIDDVPAEQLAEALAAARWPSAARNLCWCCPAASGQRHVYMRKEYCNLGAHTVHTGGSCGGI